MSAPRPLSFETDLFHPLGSICNKKQFPYIFKHLPVISSMCEYMTIAHVILQKPLN